MLGGPEMTRVHQLVLAVVLTVGSVATVGTPPVQATSSPSPNVSLTASGSAVVAASDGTPFTSTATAPITINGQTSQVITKMWNKDELQFVDGSVVAPQGWSLEYTTDGTSWSNTLPGNTTLIRGVRTTGSLQSIGFSNGLQTSITSAPSSIKQATVGSLSITGGGDGYDVFMDEAYTKIFNVWHHSSPNQIDCHSLFTGVRCSGYPITMPNSLGTNDRSTGIVVGSKVWVAAGYGSNPGGGFACFLVAGGLCSTSFISLTTNVNTAAHSNVANMERIGQYLFTQNFKDGKVLCLDTVIEAACTQMPVGGFDLGTSASQSYPSNMLVIGTRLYSNDGRGSVGCLDTTTWTRCTGWTTPWTTTRFFNIFALPNSSGQIVAICAFNTDSAGCVDSTKTAYTVPASLNSSRAALPLSNVAASNALGGYETPPRTVGTRLYWVNMVWNSSQSGGIITCWDASLNSGAGGTCSFSGQSSISDEAYSLTIDPQNADCLWTNDDNGNIESFDAITGNAGCPVPTDAVVQIPYSVAVPRYSCTEAGRIRQWDSITLSATGPTLSSMKVTIRRNGMTIPGWSNVSAAANGQVNLSSLSVSASGTQPTFEITSPGLTVQQAQTITGDVKYLSDAPQLCLNLLPLATCPTGAGLAQSSTVPRPNSDVNLTVVNAGNGATQNFSSNQSVTRTSMNNCVGTLNGNAFVSTASGPVAIPNASIQLKDSNGNVVATTTTDSSGNYVFSNAYPHGYTVHLASDSQAAPVTANATTVRNFSISSSPIVATPDAKSGLVGESLNLVANANAGVVPIVQGSVQIQNPSNNSFASSINISGVGTFTASKTANTIQFIPADGWTGKRVVTYRVSDITTGTATSTLSVTISPKPTLHVLLRNGRNGAKLTWKSSPTPSVIGYVVRLNNQVICTMTHENRTCTYPRFVSRASNFTVTSVGGDETTSTATKAVMLNECKVVGSIKFGTNLAVVTKKADAILRSIALRMKKVGSSGLCIIGHTDARSTFKSNNDLSYWRATNAYAHIKKWLPGNMSATLDFAGEYRPRATNSSAHGMMLNRRVDIGVRP